MAKIKMIFMRGSITNALVCTSLGKLIKKCLNTVYATVVFWIITAVDWFFGVENTCQCQSKELEDVIETYVNQRLGIRQSVVILQMKKSPTANSTVIERLIPQKVTAKSTLIASNKSQHPLPSSLPSRVDQLTLTSLPGMASVFGQRSVATPSVAMSQHSGENREQQLNDHIYFDKEIQTIHVSPKTLAASLSVFIPESRMSQPLNQALMRELTNFLNPFNEFPLSVAIFPMPASHGVVLFYANYDRFIGWVKAHPGWFVFGWVACVGLGVLVQYIRFLMALRLASAKKTVVIQEKVQKLDPKASKKVNTAAEPRSKLTSTPDELVGFFLKGDMT